MLFSTQLLYQEPSAGIDFEYSLTKGSVAQVPEPGDGYDWSPSSWSNCDAKCGGGQRTRQVTLVEVSDVWAVASVVNTLLGLLHAEIFVSASPRQPVRRRLEAAR